MLFRAIAYSYTHEEECYKIILFAMHFVCILVAEYVTSNVLQEGLCHRIMKSG